MSEYIFSLSHMIVSVSKKTYGGKPGNVGLPHSTPDMIMP